MYAIECMCMHLKLSNLLTVVMQNLLQPSLQTVALLLTHDYSRCLNSILLSYRNFVNSFHYYATYLMSSEVSFHCGKAEFIYFEILPLEVLFLNE